MRFPKSINKTKSSQAVEAMNETIFTKFKHIMYCYIVYTIKNRAEVSMNKMGYNTTTFHGRIRAVKLGLQYVHA